MSGRKQIPYPDNWIEVYNQWQSGDLSTKMASEMLKFSEMTLYRMSERYEIANGINRIRDKTAKHNKYRGLERVGGLTGRYAVKIREYHDFLERNILLRIDYQKLHHSFQMDDMIYAKGILNRLHQIMVWVYGSETIECPANLEKKGCEFIVIPGVIASNEEICLALLVIDLLDGDLCRADVLNEYGCNSDIETYASYQYGYTAVFLNIKYVQNHGLPDKAKQLLAEFKNHEVRFLCENAANNCENHI